jgi:hypothetical protein
MYYYGIKEESDNRFWTWDRHWLILDAPFPRYLPMSHRRRVLCPWQRSSGGASPWGRTCFRQERISADDRGELYLPLFLKRSVERPNISEYHRMHQALHATSLSYVFIYDTVIICNPVIHLISIHDFFWLVGPWAAWTQKGNLASPSPQADPDGTESAEAADRDRKLLGQGLSPWNRSGHAR